MCGPNGVMTNQPGEKPGDLGEGRRPELLKRNGENQGQRKVGVKPWSGR